MLSLQRVTIIHIFCYHMLFSYIFVIINIDERRCEQMLWQLTRFLEGGRYKYVHNFFFKRCQTRPVPGRAGAAAHVPGGRRGVRCGDERLRRAGRPAVRRRRRAGAAARVRRRMKQYSE